MTWQPIETAPKDGTAVFVYLEQATVDLARLAYWVTADEVALSGCGPEDAGWWSQTSCVGSERIWWEPTHWASFEPPSSPKPA